MKRALNFAKRDLKEIIRDPLSIIFAILLPLFLLFIFQQFKIPGEAYKLENFTPGIIIFGFSFITLFTAVLVSKDRSTSLITRLCASPMKTIDYILGYTLSVFPVVILQSVLFFVMAVFLGLKFSLNIIFAIIVSVPVSTLFILLGILIGCITSEKSSSGISSIVVQLVAFTSGMYFSSDMIGRGFDIVCNMLPFKSCVNIIKGILTSSSSDMLTSIIIVSLYIIIILVVSIVVFRGLINSNR